MIDFGSVHFTREILAVKAKIGKNMQKMRNNARPTSNNPYKNREYNVKLH